MNRVFEIAVAFVVGALLMSANLFLILLFIKRLYQSGHKGLVVFLWPIKLLSMAALIWLCLIYLRLNPVGFVVGLTLPMVVIIWRRFYA